MKSVHMNPKPQTTPEESLPKLSSRGRELALAHFNHVEQQVSLAATTAGLIVAADAILIGGYMTAAKDCRIFNSPAESFTEAALLAMFLLAGIFIVCGFLSALYAVYPNIRSKTHKALFPVHNVMFFGWIGKQDFHSYCQMFTNKDGCDGRGLDLELLGQVWGKSEWLREMFRFIQLAVFCTIAGTTLACVTLVALLVVGR